MKKGNTVKKLVSEMILDVTEVGQSYSTNQIKSRLFDWTGEYRGMRIKYIPHANALSGLIKKTKAFDRRDTCNGIEWTRKEVKV